MISTDGYILIHAPGHPVAQKDGWALEHRKVWFDANGEIPEGHVIHHRNEDRSDNRLENLVCLTRGEHAAEHFAAVAAVFAEQRRLNIEALVAMHLGKPAWNRGKPAWNLGTGEKIVLTCAWCRSTFDRSARRHRKSVKKGYTSLCSRQCQSLYMNAIRHHGAEARGMEEADRG